MGGSRWSGLELFGGVAKISLADDFGRSANEGKAPHGPSAFASPDQIQAWLGGVTARAIEHGAWSMSGQPKKPRYCLLAS